MREGRNQDFEIGRDSSIITSNLTEKAVLRVRPLTVSGFKAYRENSERRFDDNIISTLESFDPAECKYYIMLGVY